MATALGAFLALLSELETARADERAASDHVDALDASECSSALERAVAAEVYAAARTGRIAVERAAEAALAALPDAAARRAALYAAGIR